MKLSRVKKRILLDLQENLDNNAANISRNIDASRSHVSTCLGELEDDGLVRNKGAGVYTLTNSGLIQASNIRNGDMR